MYHNATPNNCEIMGVLGKCKAKKSRDFSKHFKSSANKTQG